MLVVFMPWMFAVCGLTQLFFLKTVVRAEFMESIVLVFVLRGVLRLVLDGFGTPDEMHQLFESGAPRRRWCMPPFCCIGQWRGQEILSVAHLRWAVTLVNFFVAMCVTRAGVAVCKESLESFGKVILKENGFCVIDSATPGLQLIGTVENIVLFLFVFALLLLIMAFNVVHGAVSSIIVGNGKVTKLALQIKLIQFFIPIILFLPKLLGRVAPSYKDPVIVVAKIANSANCPVYDHEVMTAAFTSTAVAALMVPMSCAMMVAFKPSDGSVSMMLRQMSLRQQDAA